MISDAERREVAAKLREVNPYRNQSYMIPCNRYTPAAEYLSELAGALGYSPKNDVSRLEFQNRLADLIEPGSERTCHIKLSKTSVWHCDGCGQTIDGNCFADNGGRLTEYRYCPNCGAKVVDA